MINENINNYIFIPLLLLFLLLQITFIPQFFSENYAPNIVLMLLIAASIINSKSSGIFFISFFIGFLLDIFSGNSFGFYMISILSAVFVSSCLSHYFLKEIFSRNLFLISVCAIFSYNILYIFLINFENFSVIYFNTEYFFIVIISQVIYTLIFIYSLTRIILIKNDKKIFYKKSE